MLKIELKDVGDPGRNVRTEVPGQEPFPLSYYFENNNRNKKGVAVDYTSRAGRDVVYRLVETSDVFISNFPIKTLDEMGFDYETLHGRNSKIIYAVATAFGPRGPDRDKPATGDTVQLHGGVLSHGNSDGPVPFWGGLAEQEDAILMAYGIVSALIARERHGIGQEVYSSMLGSQINWAALNVQGNLFNGVEPWGMRRDMPLSPVWNFYLTSDEKWIALGFLKEAKDWPDLCRTLEREDLEFDPQVRLQRQTHRRELPGVVEDYGRAVRRENPRGVDRPDETQRHRLVCAQRLRFPVPGRAGCGQRIRRGLRSPQGRPGADGGRALSAA